MKIETLDKGNEIQGKIYELKTIIEGLEDYLFEIKTKQKNKRDSLDILKKEVYFVPNFNYAGFNFDRFISFLETEIQINKAELEQKEKEFEQL